MYQEAIVVDCCKEKRQMARALFASALLLLTLHRVASGEAADAASASDHLRSDRYQVNTQLLVAMTCSARATVSVIMSPVVFVTSSLNREPVPPYLRILHAAH